MSAGAADNDVWGRYIDAWWSADPTGYGPNVTRAGGPYRPFVPPRIAGRNFVFGDYVQVATAAAGEYLVQLRASGSTPGGVHSLAETLLRSESVASSRIEGVQMSHARLARVRGSAGKEDKNAREVLGNVAAMREAIRLGATAERVTPDAIASIHRALIRDAIDGKGRAYGGMIRQEQNWIGGNDYNPLGAAFVPPPPEEVEGLLEDLSEFIERTDLQPIAQAAIAHAQFETIHPFLDGNGRTGRALVYSILRRRGELSEYVPPISLVLGGAPRTYVNALTAYREGQPETIVELFADATSRACVEAERLGERVAELREQWEERAGKLRSHATARRLLDVLPSSPVITVASGAELTGRSLRTTGVGLEQLAELGILKPLNARKWGRGWESAELFALVEDFEKRVSATQRDPAEPS